MAAEYKTTLTWCGTEGIFTKPITKHNTTTKENLVQKGLNLLQNFKNFFDQRLCP